MQVTKFIAFITLLQVYKTEASLSTPAKSTYIISHFFHFSFFQSFFFLYFFFWLFFFFFYLLKAYFPLIRYVLEYCCPMWHNALPVKLSDSTPRKRVQKRALRIIFPAPHYQEALATTGCVSLHTRRMELCSKLFTKIKEPESRLRHLVPPTRSQAHGRSLRNKDRPSLISCKTERFKRSFFPAMCL